MNEASLKLTWLHDISHPTLNKENKWAIDDIALGPLNELVISGHNFEQGKTLITLYNNPLENKPAEHTIAFEHGTMRQPVEFMKDSGNVFIGIGKKVKSYDIEKQKSLKTNHLEYIPTSFSFNKGKLYATSNESDTVIEVDLESNVLTKIKVEGIDKDYISDIVVVNNTMYICTVMTGRAFKIQINKKKKMEFKNDVDNTAKANSICVNERSKFVLILWNNFQLKLYSQKPIQLIRTFTINEANTIRITTDDMVMAANTSTCRVHIYDMSESIKFYEIKSNSTNTMSVRKLSVVMDLYEDLLEKKLQHESNAKHLEEANITEKKKAHTALKEIEELNELISKQKTAISKAESAETDLNKRLKEHVKLQEENEQLNERLPKMDTMQRLRSDLDLDDHLKPGLKISVTVARKGANIDIPDTGVKLSIPAGALQDRRIIQMIVIPFGKLDYSASAFSGSSSVAVSLFPNGMTFQKRVHLTLPHCVKLEENYKENEHQVTVYLSHSETGPPLWEKASTVEYSLNETDCTIFLESLCCVKYEISNNIVKAKLLQVYSNIKRLDKDDTIAELEVGYHLALPGREENLSMQTDMGLYQTNPFIFAREGNVPMHIYLSTIGPMEWTYTTPDENPKIIPYQNIAVDTLETRSFVLEKMHSTETRPYCMIKVLQGETYVVLNVNF